jgi:uncharacterized protein
VAGFAGQLTYTSRAMSIITTLTTDITTARKARDSQLLQALTFIKDALDKKTKEARGKAIDEVAVLRTEAKKRAVAAQEFDNAGRTELADKERYELSLIEKYLPVEASDETIDSVVAEVLAERDSPATMKDMGTVMKAVMSLLGDQASGARVSARVKNAISG